MIEIIIICTVIGAIIGGIIGTIGSGSTNNSSQSEKQKMTPDEYKAQWGIAQSENILAENGPGWNGNHSRVAWIFLTDNRVVYANASHAKTLANLKTWEFLYSDIKDVKITKSLDSIVYVRLVFLTNDNKEYDLERAIDPKTKSVPQDLQLFYDKFHNLIK